MAASSPRSADPKETSETATRPAAKQAPDAADQGHQLPCAKSQLELGAGRSLDPDRLQGGSKHLMRVYRDLRGAHPAARLDLPFVLARVPELEPTL